MKKKIILLLSFTLVLISCQNQVIEKEVIKEVSKKIKSGSISIQITQPNDNSTIKLTNDFAPINVKISGPDSISKVAWKKGAEKIGVKPGDFFSDENVHQITLDSSSSASFTVTENGWYDIVAQDVLGRYEWEQVEVRTIDKTPMDEVRNLTSIVQNGSVKLTWEDPIEINQYDSPLKRIKIEYLYDNNVSDSDNGEIFIEPGLQSALIPIANGKQVNTILYITVKAIDYLGNENTGVTKKEFCVETINTTIENAAEVIANLTFNGNVVITGNYNKELIDKISEALRTEKNIKVILDLSKITGMIEVSDLCFGGCIQLVDIVLPETIEKIGQYAFGSSGLTRINIPYGVTEIGEGAFSYCKNVEAINIPNTVTTIQDKAFYYCKHVENVVVIIPSSVNYIGAEAFVGFVNIYPDIVFEDSTTDWYFRGKAWTNDEKIGPMADVVAIENIKRPYSNRIYYNQDYRDSHYNN